MLQIEKKSFCSQVIENFPNTDRRNDLSLFAQAFGFQFLNERNFWRYWSSSRCRCFETIANKVHKKVFLQLVKAISFELFIILNLDEQTLKSFFSSINYQLIDYCNKKQSRWRKESLFDQNFFWDMKKFIETIGNKIISPVQCLFLYSRNLWMLH